MAVFTRLHLVSIGDEGNWLSVIIMGSPILWTAIAAMESLVKRPDVRGFRVMAAITGVIALLGSMTLGLLLIPVALLVFLAGAKAPR